MQKSKLNGFLLVPLLGMLSLSLGACTPGESEGANAAETAVPAQSESKALAALNSVEAPAGSYQHDPTHASLQFSLLHMGLSNYVAGFSSYSVSAQLDPANPAASSVTVSIDPTSIRTDYGGDYKATHPKSVFDSWEQDLAMSDKFFNAANYPEILYESTSVAAQPDGTLSIEGNLTLLGQTHPVSLVGVVVGSTAKHPFTKQGALGLSVTGTFKRSTFGMNYLLSPPIVGDEVTMAFEGEMHLAAAP